MQHLDNDALNDIPKRIQTLFMSHLLGLASSIPDDSLFKNTMDKYTGVWLSDFVCGSIFVSSKYLDATLIDPRILLAYKGIVDGVKTFNESKYGYKIVGVEFNKFIDCTVFEHCDDMNFDDRRIRVFMPCGINASVFKSEGIISKYNHTVAFDCTKPHSFKNSSINCALVVDLLPDNISAKEELHYLLNPFYYYLEKYHGNI